MLESKYRDDGSGTYWDGAPEEEQTYLDWFIPYQTEVNIQALWQSADTYQAKYISGAALSLLTIGVIQSKPKALAIMMWIQNIWNNNYYPQKELVTHIYQPYDFSVCGEIPYTVPELTAEVLG